MTLSFHLPLPPTRRVVCEPLTARSRKRQEAAAAAGGAPAAGQGGKRKRSAKANVNKVAVLRICRVGLHTACDVPLSWLPLSCHSLWHEHMPA